MNLLHRLIFFTVFFLTVSLLPLKTFALKCDDSTEYYVDSERGWYFREVCKEIPKDNESSEKSFIALQKDFKIPWDKLDEMDPSEIDQLHNIALKIAVQNPDDPEKVIEHKKLLKWIVTRAIDYQTTHDQVVRTNTELSKWASARPTSSIGRKELILKKRLLREKYLEDYRNQAGLAIITQPRCSACKAQKPILKRFSERTGWSYAEFNIYSIPASVKKLGVSTTPDIFLIFNDNGKALWQRIASGMQTELQIEEAIMFGLNNLGLIKENFSGGKYDF